MNMPLPYHEHSMAVAQMLPYFIDQCYLDDTTCPNLTAYKEYCYTASVQNKTLSETSVSPVDFQKSWSNDVADNLTGLNGDDLYNTVYVDTAGDYNNKARTFWKDATSAGNTGTPTAWVNGAKIVDFPFTVAGWMAILNGVLAEQVKVQEKGKPSK